MQKAPKHINKVKNAKTQKHTNTQIKRKKTAPNMQEQRKHMQTKKREKINDKKITQTTKTQKKKKKQKQKKDAEQGAQKGRKKRKTKNAIKIRKQ